MQQHQKSTGTGVAQLKAPDASALIKFNLLLGSFDAQKIKSSLTTQQLQQLQNGLLKMHSLLQQKQNKSFHQLPSGILATIFSFLTTSDLITGVIHTCKKWNSIIVPKRNSGSSPASIDSNHQHIALQRLEITKPGTITDLGMWKLFSRFNIPFSQTHVAAEHDTGRKRNNSHAKKQLKLKSINKKYVTATLSYSTIDKLAAIHGESLTVLSWDNDRMFNAVTMSESSLATFAKQFPNLHTLKISTAPLFIAKYLPKLQYLKIRNSQVVVTEVPAIGGKELLDWFGKQTHIENLTLRYASLEIVKLALYSFPNLKNLSLKECFEDVGDEEVTYDFPYNLKDFDLPSELQSVYIKGCIYPYADPDNQKEWTAGFLSRLKGVKKLRLSLFSNANSMEDYSLIHHMIESNLNTLECIKLHRAFQISDSLFYKICTVCTLQLQEIHFGKEDYSELSKLSLLKNLKRLKIYRSSTAIESYSSKFLQQIASTIMQLTKLVDLGIGVSVARFIQFSEMKSLEELSIHGAYPSFVVEGSPSLKELNVAKAQVSYLAIRNCPKLEFVNQGGSLLSIELENCPLIYRLDFHSAQLLSVSIKGARPLYNVQTISLVHNMLSLHNLKDIMLHCPNLKFLTCPSVTLTQLNYQMFSTFHPSTSSSSIAPTPSKSDNEILSAGFSSISRLALSYTSLTKDTLIETMHHLFPELEHLEIRPFSKLLPSLPTSSSTTYLPKLKSLKLQNTSLHEYAGIDTIVKFTPHITELYLHLRLFVPDASLAALPNLTKLTLVTSSTVTRIQQLLDTVPNKEKIQRLQVDNHFLMIGENTEREYGSLTLSLAFPSLKSLSLMVYFSFAAIPTGLKEFQMKLNRRIHFERTGVKNAFDALRNCKELEIMTLQQMSPEHHTIENVKEMLGEGFKMFQDNGVALKVFNFGAPGMHAESVQKEISQLLTQYSANTEILFHQNYHHQ